jgi:hypothetical protein
MKPWHGLTDACEAHIAIRRPSGHGIDRALGDRGSAIAPERIVIPESCPRILLILDNTGLRASKSGMCLASVISCSWSAFLRGRLAANNAPRIEDMATARTWPRNVMAKQVPCPRYAMAVMSAPLKSSHLAQH